MLSLVLLLMVNCVVPVRVDDEDPMASAVPWGCVACTQVPVGRWLQDGVGGSRSAGARPTSADTLGRLPGGGAH